MRDAKLLFGNVTSTGSANVIDFGEARKTGNLDQINVVVQATAGGLQQITVSDGDSAEGPFTAILVGPSVTVDAGEKSIVPMPREHKRYVTVSALAEGEGWIQPAV